MKYSFISVLMIMLCLLCHTLYSQQPTTKDSINNSGAVVFKDPGGCPGGCGSGGGGSDGDGGPVDYPGDDNLYVPEKPPKFLVSGSQCNSSRTLSWNGKPDFVGCAWYWQTSSTGTSKTYSGKNKTVSESGTYYLRGYGIYSKQWGPAVSVYVSIQPVSSPPAPKIEESKPGYTILSKDDPLNTYYWQSAPSEASTSNNEDYTAVYKSGYYYLRAKNSSTGCWSSASSVHVSINTPYTLPVIHANGESKISIKQPYVDLALNTSYASYQWYWNGREMGGAVGAVYKVFQEGYYHVVVENSAGVKVRSDYFRVEDINKSNNIAYSASHRIKVKNVKSIQEVKRLNYDGNKSVAISYYDEYKRKSQDVIVGGAPGGKDLVQGYTYSRNQKNQKAYLPYSVNSNTAGYRKNWKQELSTFYDKYDDGGDEDALFNEVVYEDSPFDRIMASSSVGEDWKIGSGHEKTYNNSLNDGTEHVIKWSVDENGNPLRSGYYSSGLLQVNSEKDEMGNVNYSYTNLLGQTILTKNALGAETYFIYDNLDRVSYILQPELVSNLIANGSDQLSQDEMNAYSFIYKYDNKNRVIASKSPGKGEVKIVYDHLNRPILIQGANLRVGDEKQWMYVKYDVFGRQVVSGLYKNNNDRKDLQKEVDDFYQSDLYWEALSGMVYNNNVITKTAPTRWSNDGGYSTTYLKEGQDGSLYVKANQTNNGIMVGFSSGAVKSDFSYPSIEFAIHFDGSGKMNVYESGSRVKRSLTRYTDSDIFSIHRVGGTILYKKNDVTIYTSSKTCVGEVYVDFSINHNNASFTIVNEKYEERTSSGYSDNAFPVSNITLLSEVYYDDYDLPWDITPYRNHYTSKTEFNTATKGLPTAYRKKELGTSNWLQTVSFYDDKYRLEANVSDNGYGGMNREAYQYSFDNKVNTIKTSMLGFNGQDIEVTEGFGYDHMGRLTGAYHKVYDGTTDNFNEQPKLIAYYDYDELGRLSRKRLGQGASGFLQSVDYRYNIKGWLTSINYSDLKNHGDEDNFSYYDYFGMEIAYNEDIGISGSNPLYNGNISSIKWSKNVTSGAAQMAYAYQYDQISQLKSAMAENNANALKDVNYDANGNINSLSRFNAEGQQIDQLNYQYDEVNGNQLLLVNDEAADTLKVFGYAGVENDMPFEYDEEGNVISDPAHGIVSIVYNILNQPKEILTENGSKILYRYAADGQRLGFSEYSSSGELVNEVVYNGQFFIKNNKIEFIKHAEGRVVYDETVGEWIYQYDLRDYQGNTRVSFTSAPKSWDFNLNYEGDNDDEALFENTESIGNDIFDHTDADDTYIHSQLLSGGEGSQLGAVISIPVGEGDKVSASVYAKYLAKAGSISDATRPIGMVLANLFSGGAIAGGESGVGIINENFTSGAIIGSAGFPLENDEAPKAFINLMFLPNSENVDLERNVSFAYDQISADATQYAGEAKSNNFDKLEINEFVSPGNGHILIYLSNESTNLTEVYFDDLQVTVEEHPVIQKNDYYPYGMISTSWVRPTNLKNEFLYNGESRWNETTKTYETSFRSYDPALGRFYGADALAANAPSLSPYRYGFNNPIMFNDPTGMFENSMMPIGFDDDTGDGGGGSSTQGLLDQLLNRTTYGGDIVNGTIIPFVGDFDAMERGAEYNDLHDSWGYRDVNTFHAAQSSFNLSTGIMFLRGTVVKATPIGYMGEPYSKDDWLSRRLDEAYETASFSQAHWDIMSSQIVQDIHAVQKEFWDHPVTEATAFAVGAFIGADAFLLARIGKVGKFAMKAGVKASAKAVEKVAARTSTTIGSRTVGAARAGFTVADDAAALSRQVGKNSINIRTTNKIIHYDLVGATHKGVATPHVQYSLRNVSPLGKVFFNKNRTFVRPMTRQDLRILNNYLGR